MEIINKKCENFCDYMETYDAILQKLGQNIINI